MSSGGPFRVLVAELATAGLDPSRVCRDAGVDPAVLDDPARPFGIRTLGRVLARAEELSADPLLGLHLAESAHGRGFLAYVFRAQPTLQRGLDEMARHAATVWDRADAVRIASRGGDATIAFHLGDAVPRFALEFVVARVAIALRQGAAKIREVSFAHAPAGAVREYERVLGAPVRFRRPATALRVDATALGRPQPTANADAAAALAAGLRRSEVQAAASTGVRLSRAVEAALADGAPIDRETLARALGMSGRTLARRLAADGGSFHALVDDARRRLARRLVDDGALPLGEIASRCGFADQAAFGKAFRRWFGTAPSALRARRRGP